MSPYLRNQRAFALVLVLSLLALLVLITYAISSISRVDAQMGTAGVYQVQARQNALLGLKLSLSQLQQAAGPLTSVTATAQVLASTRQENNRWTGVWQSAAAPVWLVSGGVSPSSFSAGFDFGADTGDGRPILTQSPDNIVLVGNWSTNTAASRYLFGDAVLVPKVLIVGQLGSGAYGANIGHYAYWVGDEGVKLSVQLPGENPPLAPTPSAFDISEIQYSWTPDASRVPNVLSYSQLLEAGAGSTTIKNTFHHATLLHLGFLDTGNRRAGLYNINSASARAWRSVAKSFDSNQSNTRSQNFANEIVAGLGSGPYQNVVSFGSSLALQNAVARLSGVSVAQFLASMEEWFTVRSDTFRIRAYGDALNPADAGVSSATPEAVAYCEAIVQRTSDDAWGGNGKKFVITYFRWLGPDDI